MNLQLGRSLAAPEIADLLTEARARTLFLVSPLSDEDLVRQHDPLMSPVVWDLGHIAHFEEVWLLEALETGGEGSEGLRGMYNPFENPRGIRDRLPLPTMDECQEYMGRIRRAVLDNLQWIDLSSTEPLLESGFVFRMVLQHEYQHNETILQTLQLKQGAPYPAVPAVTFPVPARRAFDEMVRFPGGSVALGTNDRSGAYDNERPLHTVDLAPFWIDTMPVTNGAFERFVAGGGYGRRDLWSDAGWAWREESGVGAPKHWEPSGGRWTVRTMNRVEALAPDRPVCHVCFHEAEAYARFVGKRLPSEAEWEAAATWDPERGEKRFFPWGDEPATLAVANVDILAFGTAPVRSFARNVSPIGCYGMIGDVWEWTSTEFYGYPGYETFPYPEYSEAFFGDEYKILRGGSWATRGGALRATFRNWDYPIRRQIFSGFRCAKDD
jgi:gamma-glutamyl hercynylcysteine S-oxide synthase